VYEAEMEELRSSVVAMGDRCQRALRTGLEAFRSGSAESAQAVEDIDRLVDADEMAIDALVIRILALRQPVASDLRLLAMTLKLVTDLERIGDEAVNIADRATDGRCHVGADVYDALERMSSEAQRMVAGALEAFVREDGERAREVLRDDDVVDELYGKTMRAVESYMMQTPAEVPGALCIMSVAKYLERVADHATNIAEEVIFVVQGEDVRHHGSVAALEAAESAENAEPAAKKRSAG
jgi:phosphate transport system protein